ncbi:hypothetical protein OsI_37612 [Oryza sativa Indica Group]|uniref:V-ATPase proteolipid subunit C-like domain-containing protein n=1 Tax=Oryza sativa subsp. indica TaxID=39946 RepID=B8BND2_ORYSI|nr:hypothetical protein OsI_37612 [Oryza sativa Indica Group]
MMMMRACMQAPSRGGEGRAVTLQKAIVAWRDGIGGRGRARWRAASAPRVGVGGGAWRVGVAWANAQQPKLFVGMILILIFAEALALYGLIVGIILSSRAGQSRAD